MRIPMLCLTAILFMGCASVSVTKTKEYPAYPSNCQIDLYTDPNEIKKGYEIIAVIESKTGTTVWDDRTSNGAIEKSKPSACACGGNGLLIQNLGFVTNTWEAERGHALLKVIRYTP